MRTRRWPHLALRRLDAAWPRTPMAWATVAGGTSATGCGMADGGVREGRRGERKMMVQSVMDRGRAEQRGRDEAELGRPAMADAARERGERGMERAGSGEGDGEGVLVPLLIGSRAQGTAVEADHAARKLSHGGSALVQPEREQESEKGWGSTGVRLWMSRACGSAWHRG